MKIPKIIHQTWKTDDVPKKWLSYQKIVQNLHPDWEYKLWTDKDNDEFVRKEFPELYDIYNGFSKNIMRADVIRYLIMDKIGGLYLDLDYEMLKPFNFKDSQLILPKNRSLNFGDSADEIGNCVFASVPNHQFWKDVINDIKNNPPQINDYTEVIDATGPGLLTRIYHSKDYIDIDTPDRIIFHPPSPTNNKEYKKISDYNLSYGIHHCSGSWIERYSWAYFRKKLFKQ